MEKPFMEIDNQIKQLRDGRGLLFNSEEHARDMLTRYGYYEIINGYKDHFMIDSTDDSQGFTPGITFEHIFSLFELDRHLREGVMNSLELFEANIRQVIAYTVAQKISDDQEVYIQRKQYRTGIKYYDHHLRKYTYPIDKLISTMKKIVSAKTDPYKHYREHHGNVPPWILVKKLSFGNLIWWFKLMDSEYSDLIISRMLNIPESFISTLPELRETFGSMLTLYLDYRNTAAHGGRIYNHRSQKHALPYLSFLHKQTLKISEADYRLGKGQSQLGMVLKTLAILDNKDPVDELNATISYYSRQYLKQFPNDEQYLLSKMELTHDWIFKD
ncbi:MULTISPECIES: Abi family protein [Lactobacillaceae]|uniref:Abi family protein n=1 Tax=Lactobacillaceae TaxID=33958 RepID=UPI001456CEDA|nr:Abi family protein [Lactobacillus sp. HBUAS51381]NLR08708.1 Abi family protein [Lactobacillus sp. HBUAS51381]